MNILKIVLGRVEGFLETRAAKYRDAYLAPIKHLPDSEQGYRGVFLP